MNPEAKKTLHVEMFATFQRFALLQRKLCKPTTFDDVCVHADQKLLRG